MALTASAQPYFEIVPRGQVEPSVLQAARHSTLVSLAHLARIGVVLDSPPKVYVCASRSDYADVLVEVGGLTREEAQRWLGFSGLALRGAIAINLPRVEEQRITVLWVIAHEVFHLYQSQSRLPYRMPVSARESAADVHKLKVLEEQGVLSIPTYVRRTLIPSAQRARRAQPSYSLADWSMPTGANVTDFYSLWTVGGHFLFQQQGGWPRMVALYAPNAATSFTARFEEVYGVVFSEFEQEFFTWLDRQ